MTRSNHLTKLLAICGATTLFAASLPALTPQAAAPHTPPRISPVGQAAQVVGLTGITVTYGRPAVKERTIWGELVPFGQVWRTGANDATVVTFSEDVEVEGQALAAGTYALFSVPEENHWTVIFNEGYKQWGAFQYQEDQDVLRVRVTPRAASHQELFTVDFPEAGDEETVMRLRWGKIAVPIRIRSTFSDDALIARARHAATLPEGAAHLWEWTGYLMQRGITLPEMPEWTDRIAEAFPGFYAISLKANVLAQLGRTDDAVATGEKALAAGEKELGTSPFLTRAALDKFSGTVAGWREKSPAKIAEGSE